jgi:hypothetical protein
MPHVQPPFFDRIGKMLHAHFDAVVDEPLRKRWVEPHQISQPARARKMKRANSARKQVGRETKRPLQCG